MPSSSFFGLFTAGLAAFAGAANAYTKPVGNTPVGNPFSAPGLNSVVPVGKPFTITWNPTTPGTVTLVLLKGPAQNLAVVGPIVEQIPNSGSYDWTPSSDLAPGQTGYGIQLIVDSNGQYQYTTQFGISNPGYTGSDSSSSTSSSYGQSSTSSAKPSYMVAPGLTSSAPVRYSTSVATLSTYTGVPSSSAAQSSYVVSSSHKPSNGTSYSATLPSYTTTPSSVAPATTTTRVTTGGASGLTASFAGLVVAAGVAVFAL